MTSPTILAALDKEIEEVDRLIVNGSRARVNGIIDGLRRAREIVVEVGEKE